MMRSKLFKRPHRPLPDILIEALPRHCIEGIRQFVHQATTDFVRKKQNPASAGCVCVTHLHRCKTSDIIFDLAGVCKA